MPAAQFTFLSQEDVVSAGGLDMGPTIEVVEEALRLHAHGDAVLPPKVSILWGDGLDSDEREGRIMAMPAYVGGDMNVAGLKWIPSVPDNPSRGLPRGIGLIVLTDRSTGLPLCILDGTVISAMRTGAVTGVAVRLLANAEAVVVAILGAGVQARTQLMGLEAVLPLVEVRIWDVGPGRAQAFCKAEAREGFRLVATADPATACRDALVVVAATMAPTPYVLPQWLAPGATFVSISSLDPTLEVISESDLLVCDVWEHESKHHSRPFARAVAAGTITRKQVAELGEILVGRHPGRIDRSQRVFVSPVGLGIEDVAAAYRVYRRATELGIGTQLDLWREAIWT